MSLNPVSVDISAVTRSSDKYPGKLVLDPQLLLASFLERYPVSDVILAVTLSDDKDQVAYNLVTFLSRDYEIEDGIIKFGLKRISVERLRVTVSHQLRVALPAGRSAP